MAFTNDTDIILTAESVNTLAVITWATRLSVTGDAGVRFAATLGTLAVITGAAELSIAGDADVRLTARAVTCASSVTSAAKLACAGLANTAIITAEPAVSALFALVTAGIALAATRSGHLADIINTLKALGTRRLSAVCRAAGAVEITAEELTPAGFITAKAHLTSATNAAIATLLSSAVCADPLTAKPWNLTALIILTGAADALRVIDTRVSHLTSALAR